MSAEIIGGQKYLIALNFPGLSSDKLQPPAIFGSPECLSMGLKMTDVTDREAFPLIRLASNMPRMMRLRSDVTRDMLPKGISAAHIDRLLRGEHLAVVDTGMYETIFCLSFVETRTYVRGAVRRRDLAGKFNRRCTQ
jgi:hypothetical protein